jgi:hypothetical protein
MTCDIKNHIDAKGCTTYVIAKRVNNPQKLTLKANGSFAAKVMVFNIAQKSISEEYAQCMNRSHTFDLSKHKGECSITVVIYNLTSNEITIDSYLKSEGQMHIEIE